MLNRWQQQFPGCEPVAHRLKEAFPDRWVRFHSLPESKRYPEDESEYATVLYRHNCILGELIGPERGVILLTTGYSDSTEPVRPQPEPLPSDPDAVLWRSVPLHELDGDFAEPNYWHVFASVREWRPGLFDQVVRSVADDVMANVMVVDPNCQWLLHPYDGGMDVIAESSTARNHLKSRHADWLSPYTSGL
jgi:hypothetical protein